MTASNRFMHRIFSNDDTASSNTRKSFFFLFVYLCSIAVCVFLFAQFLPKQWFWYTWGISSCFAALLVWRWFLKKEGRSFPDPWVTFDKYTVLRFIAGLGVGSLILLVIFLLLIYLLGLELAPVSGSNIWTVLGWNSALAFCAFHEEIGFRSYALQRLQAARGTWKSQAIIAVVFACYHILGGQDVVNALLSTSLWSVIFGLAAIRSEGLALPTGIHAASTIGQAFFGMKLKEGFPAIYVLKPGHIMPANIPLVVLITQSLVLAVAIIIFSLMVRNKRARYNSVINYV